MLQLKNIKKDYYVGGHPIPALRGINLQFNQKEFVAILGESGSGKTTLLNVIGGLDHYTSGDLLINQKSTKGYKDADWDAYRNASIGFVFQNYNLISHLSVIDNVEMALALSGVSSKERKERATKVLEEVGLIDHINKKPNQLSGGQMQRVAIARALINNPSILLADEPTGAIDSKTSRQIMNLIKDISKDRLVIMVTHNRNIAETYADRIVELLDGEVIKDTKPTEAVDSDDVHPLLNKKTAMNYWTAIKSSFKNLLTKRGRTIITAIAGSIGIIGVALVLSISNGMTNYVNDLQTESLAGFPITISQNVFTNQFGPNNENNPLNNDVDDHEFTDDPIIYSYDRIASYITHENIITDEYLTYLDNIDSTLYSSISYSRNLQMNLLYETDMSNYQLVSTGALSTAFSEIPDSQSFIESQYDILDGVYPTDFDDLVLVVDESNQIDLTILTALGVTIEDTYTFDDFIGLTFQVIPNDLFYHEQAGIYVPNTDYDTMYASDDSITVEIVGIMRVNEDSTSELLSTGIGYTTLLTEHMLDIESSSDIVLAQTANPSVNILTGTPFSSQVTYDDLMKVIGGDSTPVGVQIYPLSFDSKDEIKAYLDDYNVGLADEDQIIYADLAELISSTISSLINTITIVLTAFAAISLVVSSIMIGIITYVSVVERTKEIGIMRSLGARKKDISRIFNAETILIGFTAGVLGVVVALLLNIPINIIVERLIDVPNIASLPIYYAAFMILLSTALTFIAGLFPSRIAANKDPVVALRTE